MPGETINEVNIDINKHVLQSGQTTIYHLGNGWFISTCFLQSGYSEIMLGHFASHLITLHRGVHSLLSAKIIIPVDDVDGEVTEWKDHSENIHQSNLIFGN